MTAEEDLERHVRDHVVNWLIKTPADPSPHRITGQDIALIVSCMKTEGTTEGQRNHDAVRLNLENRLDGWLVQRARGERPSFINPDDISGLLALLPLDISEDTDTTTESAAPEPADPDRPAPVTLPAEPTEHAYEEKIPLVATHHPDETHCDPGPEQQPMNNGQDSVLRAGSEQDRFPVLDFSRFHLDHGV